MATFCPCLKGLTSRFRSSERVTTTQNDIDEDDDALVQNSAVQMFDHYINTPYIYVIPNVPNQIDIFERK